MGLIKEPKNIDFTIQSEPWTEEELKEFRELMYKIKAKNSKNKLWSSNSKKKINV